MPSDLTSCVRCGKPTSEGDYDDPPQHPDCDAAPFAPGGIETAIDRLLALENFASVHAGYDDNSLVDRVVATLRQLQEENAALLAKEEKIWDEGRDAGLKYERQANSYRNQYGSLRKEFPSPLKNPYA